MSTDLQLLAQISGLRLEPTPSAGDLLSIPTSEALATVLDRMGLGE